MKTPQKVLFLLLFVTFLALFFAQVEIQIEGAAGWAANLPTWRVEQHWLLDIFWGGRPMTGYHAWVFPFMLLAFHLPAVMLAQWSWRLEARILGCVAVFWIIEDALWFLLNPAFGLGKLTPEFVPWHKHWWMGLPTDYWTFSAIGLTLIVLSYRAYSNSSGLTDIQKQGSTDSSHEPAFSENEIVLYPSYIGPQGGVAEGRIIKRRNFKRALFTDSGWRNFRRSLWTLINRERKGIAYTLTIGDFISHGNTDDEGYFKCALPATEALGWQTLTVHAAGTEAAAPCLVLNSSQPMVGIISDLDDTLQVSEVTKKIKLITNSIFKNALQRHPVEGAAACFRQWAAQHPHTPVFYLSATPRQLYSVIHSFFLHHQFPQGIIITRRLSFDQQSDSLNVRAYKTAKIEQIFSTLPQIKFRLVGDDGEHDPDIYHDIQTRFPHQVDSIWIRRVKGVPLKYSGHQDFKFFAKS